MNSMCTSIATSTAMTAVATQRPGCRTGTALMFSGRPVPTSHVVPDVTHAVLARSAVDRGRGDGAVRDTPLVEDRLVAAVGDHRRERCLDRLLQRAGGLRDRDAVRRDFVRLAGELECARSTASPRSRRSGESADPTLARPLVRARFAAFWSSVDSAVTAGLPPSVQAFERAGISDLLCRALLDRDGQTAQR